MTSIYKLSTYNEYPINTEYTINKSSIKSVFETLAYCKDNMKRPYAIRYTLHLENNNLFSIERFTRLLRQFKYDYALIYNFERAKKQKGLHLELCIIIDREQSNPNILRSYLIKIATSLEGVKISTDSTYTRVGLNFHKRWNDSGIGHNLKDQADFEDSVYRYSYLAKIDDKIDLNINNTRTFGKTIRIGKCK